MDSVKPEGNLHYNFTAMKFLNIFLNQHYADKKLQSIYNVL